MMGHREQLKGGYEWDAFHRRSRRIVRLRNVLPWIKAKFHRRVRKIAKTQLSRGRMDEQRD